MKRKIGLLLSLPPSHSSASTVHGLAEAALQAGHEVYLYLIDEGVKNIHTPRKSRKSEKNYNIHIFNLTFYIPKFSTTSRPKTSMIIIK